jgi:Ran GTPase-activating protein (RanGAP) involved in mRNA processing and transport
LEHATLATPGNLVATMIIPGTPGSEALLTLCLKDNKLATKEAGKALAAALAANSVLTELDVSSNSWNDHEGDKGDGVGFAQELAAGIKDNGALLVLSLQSNNLGPAGGKALASGLKGNQVITELNISSNNLGTNSNYDSDTSGIIAIADAIPDMGAMTSLDVSDNNLGALVLPEGWQFDKSASSWDERMYRHADGREQKSNPGKPDGIIALANAISDMGALLVLSLKENGLGTEEGGKVIGEMLKGNSVLRELDLSGNGVGPVSENSLKFAVALSPGLADNGTMSSVNLLKNEIDVDQAEDLVSILKEHPTLTSLCGNKGDETELDMSCKQMDTNGKMSGAGDAIMLAAEIIGNRAMTSLNLANTELWGPLYARDISGNNKCVFISPFVCYVILCSFGLFRRDRSCQRPP